MKNLQKLEAKAVKNIQAVKGGEGGEGDKKPPRLSHPFENVVISS